MKILILTLCVTLAIAEKAKTDKDSAVAEPAKDLDSQEARTSYHTYPPSPPSSPPRNEYGLIHDYPPSGPGKIGDQSKLYRKGVEAGYPGAYDNRGPLLPSKSSSHSGSYPSPGSDGHHESYNQPIGGYDGPSSYSKPSSPYNRPPSSLSSSYSRPLGGYGSHSNYEIPDYPRSSSGSGSHYPRPPSSSRDYTSSHDKSYGSPSLSSHSSSEISGYDDKPYNSAILSSAPKPYDGYAPASSIPYAPPPSGSGYRGSHSSHGLSAYSASAPYKPPTANGHASPPLSGYLPPSANGYSSSPNNYGPASAYSPASQIRYAPPVSSAHMSSALSAYAPPPALNMYSAPAPTSYSHSAPSRYAPPPMPDRYASAPTPSRYAPANSPSRYAPAPSPSRYAPAPSPNRYAPAPSPSRYAPAPAPSRYAPPPAPNTYAPASSSSVYDGSAHNPLSSHGLNAYSAPASASYGAPSSNGYGAHSPSTYGSPSLSAYGAYARNPYASISSAYGPAAPSIYNSPASISHSSSLSHSSSGRGYPNPISDRYAPGSSYHLKTPVRYSRRQSNANSAHKPKVTSIEDHHRPLHKSNPPEEDNGSSYGTVEKKEYSKTVETYGSSSGHLGSGDRYDNGLLARRALHADTRSYEAALEDKPKSYREDQSIYGGYEHMY